MFNVAPIEWVGYSASLFIVISLTMTSIVKLRIINSIGCLLFVIYGLIIMINIYNLYMLFKSKRQ